MSDPVFHAAWAAGFMEGEGSFLNSGRYNDLRVKATQVDREPLDRLHAMYGGSFSADRRLRDQHDNRFSRQPQWNWTLTGAAAYEAGLEWLPYLSTRRRATLEQAIETWASTRSHLFVGGTYNGRRRTHCFKGHEFTEENTYYSIDHRTGNRQRTCKTCNRTNGERTRALARERRLVLREVLGE